MEIKNPISSLIEVGGRILDKVIPDPAARDAAKLKLLEVTQAGEFKADDLRYGAINREAESADPWTSRARPSFFYVMYIYILAALPIGALSIFSPESAIQITQGVKGFLSAIPDILYQVFIAGFLGYTTARTVEKVKGVEK
jgi:hypothetical protein